YLSENGNVFEWHKSPQIKELISMAKLQKDIEDRSDYMVLQEFAKAKSHERDRKGNIIEERGFYLDRYSNIVHDSPTIDFFTNIELVKDRIEKLQDQKKKQLDKEKANEQADEILQKQKE